MDGQNRGCLCSVGAVTKGRWEGFPLSSQSIEVFIIPVVVNNNASWFKRIADVPSYLVIHGISYWGKPGVCYAPSSDPLLFAVPGGSNCLSSAPPSGIAVLLSDTSASQGPTNTVSIPFALLFTPWGPAGMFSLPSTITVIAPVRPSQVCLFFPF